MSDELAVKKPPFRVGAVGLAAKKANATALDPARAPITVSPQEMPDRIGIVFDDSGSMAGGSISNAHTGVEEFLRSCKPQTTAVAVYPMNAEPLRLSTDLPALAVLVKNIGATGGTPAMETLLRMLRETSLTRAIVFSDGGYSEYQAYEQAVVTCKEKKIPVDTVYIGHGESAQLQKLAEITGGIYLRFDPAKSNFRTAFKYLSPGFRAMLADKSFVDKLSGR